MKTRMPLLITFTASSAEIYFSFIVFCSFIGIEKGHLNRRLSKWPEDGYRKISYAIRMTDEVTMVISIRILRIKTGMVILVGKAERLVTRVMPIAAMANTNK